MPESYPLEDVRLFYIRRTWFRWDSVQNALTADEREQIKRRVLILLPDRAALVRAFIEGYLFAKR